MRYLTVLRRSANELMTAGSWRDDRFRRVDIILMALPVFAVCVALLAVMTGSRAAVYVSAALLGWTQLVGL